MTTATASEGPTPTRSARCGSSDSVWPWPQRQAHGLLVLRLRQDRRPRAPWPSPARGSCCPSASCRSSLPGSTPVAGGPMATAVWGGMFVFVFFGLVATLGTQYTQWGTSPGSGCSRPWASAPSPPRSLSSTTCATSPGTPSPASARSRFASATGAPAAVARVAAGLRGRVHRHGDRHAVGPAGAARRAAGRPVGAPSSEGTGARPHPRARRDRALRGHCMPCSSRSA